MSKKKRDKIKKNQPPPATFSLQLAEMWKEKKPVILFLLGFGLLMAVFYAFWFSETFITNILDPVVKVNAVVASALLNLFALGTHTNGLDISSPAFTINLKQGCDAIEPIAIFTFAVMLFPVSFRTKGIGLLMGIPFLWVLNQIRIISLFMFGIYSTTLFEIMHVQVWQAVFIAATLICLGYWIVWALRKDKLRISTIT